MGRRWAEELGLEAEGLKNSLGVKEGELDREREALRKEKVEKGRLEDDLSKSIFSISELTNELAASKVQMSEKCNELAALKKVCDSLEKDCKILESELKTLTGELHGKQKLLDEGKYELKLKVGESDRLRDSNGQLRRELGELQAAQRSKEMENQKLKGDLDGMLAALKGKDLETERLGKLLASEKDEGVGLRGEVKRLKGEMGALDAEFGEVEERLKFKENDLELVTNKLKSLLGEKVDLETQIETLKTENYELGSLLGLSKADCTKINKSNEGLRSETARIHENLRNRDIEVDRLQGLVKDHVNTIETWRDDLERLETQSRQQAEAEHLLRSEIGKKTEDLDSLRKIYEESKDEESRLSNLNKSLSLEVADYLEA